MKRSRIDLATIADWHNLAAAFQRAARGKGQRDEVRQFRADLNGELTCLRESLLDGSVEVGQMRCFPIRDPKPRVIAPGQGLPIGALTSQHFANITVQFPPLAKGGQGGFESRLWCEIPPNPPFSKGGGECLLANYYLAGLDRLLLEGCPVRGLVRYMDDLVWWGDDKMAVRDVLAQARTYVQERLCLTIKTPVRIGRSGAGLSFCGYRLLPGRLLLSRRRKRRYAECRRDWEDAYAAGRIDAHTLQSGYATALAITAHADAATWRREQLRRHPLAPSLCDL